MRAMKLIVSLLVIASLCIAPNAFAAKREKFGTDKRHEEVKRELRKIKTSEDEIKWKMVMPWSKGLLFYDIAQHFADSVKLASGGRLDIKLFSSGELVGANEVFDAVSKGSVQIAHSSPLYWKGRNEAFVAYASVPFGLDAEGYNIWLYERGGLEMLQELYKPYGIYALPAGQTGQEMGMFSNKKATKMSDFKGMRVRTPGWNMDILNGLGASVSPLPGGEVYLALERGVIDAAEYSTPAINYPMGFDDITKYVIEPGVHQPGFQCDLMINQKAWDSLPADLQWIVKIAAKETQLWSNAWIENLNTEAINKFKEKIEFVTLDKDTRIEFAKTTKAYLDQVKAKHPDVKAALDSQEQFKKDFAEWRRQRSGVTPWPIDEYIAGEHMQ
ncbi:TRAP-type mannitol/chloroaromatic compound transport system, substrate-binding protein [Malonomonas rubra DSM 5091]|uniref:TRAP-type mannitol/chloroaromatic compound transport system, substrate-binding protein n=1 Tax=Malonomonas rubra DSM 5091 TaxID=1122189 RepID=A0A1M6FDA4_MALRU|nr:TRAP transporter substrate-binding protein DctP [Malonomonas rubra]SHI95720.1 TRAP-type mannitol/chloroaromatic compound transport system, substrate-binding protein [Malonomonas rubra DSM 5091]